MAPSGGEIDLYEILGVQRDASSAEIKKAYHKLALANHPDKVPAEQREEAEIIFKSINQAYDILFDEDKRQAYDVHGIDAFDGSKAGSVDLDDILAQMFGGMGAGMGPPPGMGASGPGRPRKGPDEVKPYPVTLESLYIGKTQKFTATKNVICSHCKGRGGKEHAKPKQCSSCKGEGFKPVLRQSGNLLTQEMAVCGSCQGNGHIYNDKDKCKKCKGKRTVTERKALEIYVPRGSHNGDKIVLSGEADQVPGQEPGDIVFVLEEQEHQVFERAGADLSADLEITLAEALCGFSRVVITHLDGRGLQMNHQKPQGGVLQPLQAIRIQGEGMPIKKTETKGDLYLIVKVKFPEDDWLQSETVTSTLKAVLPKPDPPIEIETVDEVTYDPDADLDDMGNADPNAWEDEEDEDAPGPQCAQQ